MHMLLQKTLIIDVLKELLLNLGCFLVKLFFLELHSSFNLFFFLLATSRVVVALCGGNIDTTALGRVIDRGLAADGRLIRFVVTVSDRPGGIAELTKLLADMGVR